MCVISVTRDVHGARNKIKPRLLHAKKFILYPGINWGAIEKNVKLGNSLNPERNPPTK